MIKKFLNDFKKILDTLNREPLGKLIEALVRLKNANGRLFILGVGGSAANASHAVNDFRKICEIQTFCPTDNPYELTARINDDGWDNSYVDWLELYGVDDKDVVLILSVGGGAENVSQNLVKVIDYSKAKGAFVSGIVGRDGGYTKNADACILIPTVNEHLITPFVESMQTVLLHLLAFLPALSENLGKWEQIDQK